MRKFLPLLLVFFFISSAAAYNFGTFSYQTSKEVTGKNVSFQLGLINPENSSLTIQLDTEGLENGEVVFPESSFVLEPSEISQNPEGDRWISIETGEYAKVERINFWVIMDRKIDEEFEVSIRSRKANSDNTGIRPDTVQIRDYSYSINYPEEESFEVPRGYQGEERSDEGPEIIRENDEDSGKMNSTGNRTSESIEDNNQTGNFSETNASKTNETSTSKQEESSNVSLLLLTGAVGSLLYLWMVV